MMTRREALGLLGSVPMARWLASPAGRLVGVHTGLQQGEPTPPLARGAPMSTERLALITAFKARSEGIERSFEARTHRSDWVMPYRLFRSTATGTLPLVIYLHGSGGLGDDNLKQMGLGNVFGSRLWALPDNQRRFPCHVMVPQTDRGWIQYGAPAPGDSVARPVAGLGDGARLVLEIIEALRRELAIDQRRIYLTGQSMGGAGVWHLTAQRPDLFAAAVACCGSRSADDPAASAGTPLWNFHGDADRTVPVSVSRDRLAAVRRAGGHPLQTEYAGVDHNSWEWAYTEPALLTWLFAQRRRGS